MYCMCMQPGPHCPSRGPDRSVEARHGLIVFISGPLYTLFSLMSVRCMDLIPMQVSEGDLGFYGITDQVLSRVVGMSYATFR